MKLLHLFIILLLATAHMICGAQGIAVVSYTSDIKVDNLKFYWKDAKGHILRSLSEIDALARNQDKKLVFAMNGGMYKKDNSPQGLYIEDRKELAPIDTTRGEGNFYLQPNGVFYITTDTVAVVCETKDFSNKGNVKYATQSGPMLVVNGDINSAFKEGSENLNIRNGVGILPDGKVVFAMSKVKVNFYDFAKYFQNLGCKNALYLDGYVSRMFLPQEKWVDTDGDFGVIIAVMK